MYPNQYPNNNPQVNPPDYLSQIAPHAPKQANFIQKQPIIVAVIALFVIIILFAIIGSLSGGTKPTEQLAARLVSTQTIADGATTNLQSSQLRALNSDLKIYLTNTIRDLGVILKSSDNINIKQLDKKVVAAEANTQMTSNLEDARLNGIYDRTYAREMAYQLDTILTLMLQINNNSNSKSLKSFLTDARTNLEPTQKLFEDFNADNI